MLNQLKYLLGLSPSRPVFVIGTGRSGTHWLGYSLRRHPEVRATVEANPMFGLSTAMALNPALEQKLFWRLAVAYRWHLLKSSPRLYVDKTHPNIWITERLKCAFPDALFIGIERSPYATVASMMKHPGVSAWHRRWREFPVPNRFLGITSDLADHYDSIPFAAQCALRWLAHRDKKSQLRASLGDSLLVISYERYAQDPTTTLAELGRFLGLQKHFPLPTVKLESLRKWSHQLSDSDIMTIQQIVGFSPAASTW